jgi:hypothetical protein
MTFLLQKYDFISEFIETSAFKVQQFIIFLNKVLTGFIVIVMLFLSLFAIIGMASHTQKLEADVGLRHKNVSIEQVGLFNKIQNAILNPVKANAFSLNPLDGIGEIIKGVAEPIFNIILKLINNIILPVFDTILKPILSALNTILDTINGLLTMIDGLGANISATRIGVGFRVYRDIEGSGSGSSNFESSGNFTKRLLGLTASSTSPSILNSNFPKKTEVKNLIADSIAWSDFMAVQIALQSNILGTGDVITTALKAANISSSNLFNFEEVNRNVTDVIIGKKCENSDLIFSKTPVFNSFGGVPNTCVAENRGIITQQLSSRQQQLSASAIIKSQQYEVKLPPECKYGQYFDIPEGLSIKYEDSNPGTLAINISLFASKISLKSISASECHALTTGSQNHTNKIAQLLSPTNILSSLYTGTSLTVLLNDIFNKSSKELFSSITAKFDKAVKIIKSIFNSSAIKSGVGLYGALVFVIGLREKINSKLSALNQEYEEFRKGRSIAFSNGTLNELNTNIANNSTEQNQSGSDNPCNNTSNALLQNGGGCPPGGFNIASGDISNQNNTNPNIKNGVDVTFSPGSDGTEFDQPSENAPTNDTSTNDIG